MVNNPWLVKHNEVHNKLKTLSPELLREVGTKLGLHPEICEEPDLVIDIGAEYIADSPELESVIP